MKLSELLLLYISENNLLYDIVDLIGLENALKLVSVFGGEKITIPNRDTIRNDIVSVLIYSILQSDPEDIDKIQMLSSRFALSEREIKKRFNKVKNDFQNGEMSKTIGGKNEDMSIKNIEKFILELAD